MFLFCVLVNKKNDAKRVCVCVRVCIRGIERDNEELHRSLDVTFLVVISYDVVYLWGVCVCVCVGGRGVCGCWLGCRSR